MSPIEPYRKFKTELNNKKEKTESIIEKLLNKLNVLALNILEDLEEARRMKKTVDFETLKAPLLAIKEIKDLVKINDKIIYGKTSDLLDVDLDDFANVNKLEEELYEGSKRERKS